MTEPSRIREFIATRVPNEAVRMAVFSALASIIEQVNSEDNDVWSFTFVGDGQLRLNVGSIEAFNTSENKPDAWFMILAERSRAEDYVRQFSVADGRYSIRPFRAPVPASRNIERFFVEGEEFVQHGSELLAMWRDAVSTVARQYDRTNHARHHNQDAVEMVGEMTGRQLPSPLYGQLEDCAEYPAPPYPEIQSASAGGTLRDRVFQDSLGEDHASKFAEAIETVHNENRNIWSLLSSEPDGHFTALNVQDINVISLGDKFRFLVRRETVDVEQLKDTFDSYVRYEGYAKFPDLVQVEVGNDCPEPDQEELWRAHLELLVTLAAAPWSRNAQYKNHRDDVRVFLESRTRRAIPAPRYVPLHRRGLTRWPERGPAGEVPPKVLGVTLLDRFSSVGLTYTGSQIASFYTALQTKGFVILSGISGTGKSKIAQRFADMLPSIETPVLAPGFSGTFQVTYQQYMKDHGQIRLLNKVSSLLPVPDAGDAYNIPMTVNGLEGTCRFWTRPPGNGGTYIHPHGQLKAALKTLDVPSFWLHFVTDKDESKVDRIDLVLTDSGQPAQVVHGMETRSNHLFLPVRPDWRDGKALIGYHNPLTGTYVRTDFLDFVIAAQDDYRAGNRNAFFVILDEMNLAHVEYYFADVLSVIESGRDAEGWTVEGIPLAIGDEDADLPDVLRLPPNLYIVGTVNMDETTHPFSPKVLDRAFTIELTDVDFSDYPPEPVEVDDVPSDDERQVLLDAFTGGGERYPRIDKTTIRATVAAHERFRSDLASLNASLKRYRMHFGYRVFDEIVQFVHNAERNGLFASSDDAFDHAVLMKVLPKFHGARSRLEHPLYELLHWCERSGVLTPEVRGAIEGKFIMLSDELRPFDTIVPDAAKGADDAWRYPATGRRAALMMQDLFADGFASFG